MAAAYITSAPRPLTQEPPIRFIATFDVTYVIALSALAAWLRLSHIASRSFWVDEGSSIAIARLDWWNFLRLLWRREANMSLYYLLLRGWLHFGSSESWIRGLSALFGVIAVAAIYFLAKRMWGRGAAVIASALLAVNAYHIRYSDEVRGYSLAVLLVILSSASLLKLLEHLGSRWRWAYAITSALAIYAHFYAALILFAQWIWLYFQKLSPEQGIETKRAIKATAILSVPLILFLFTTGAGPLAWLPRPGWRSLSQLFIYLSGGSTALAVLYVIFAAAHLLLHYRRANANYFSLVALWVSFPILLVFAASWIRPLFLPRFLIVCLPAWCLLAAAGLGTMRPRVLGWAGAAALLLLSIPADQRLYAQGFDQPNEDWRNATAYVLARSQATDGAIFYSSQCRMPFDFYAGGAANKPGTIFPAHATTLSYLDFMGKPDERLLLSLNQRTARLWLVMCHNQLPSGYDANTEMIRAALARQFRLVSSAEFPGVKIERYER